MALYTTIEGILKSRTEEQARIYHAVQLCTEITVLKTQPRSSPCLLPEENLLTDASIVDKEEMDLLEKALEKALQQEVIKWTQFKHKEIRLWDKVLALEKKPVSGRDQFITRMRGMFPGIRPCSSMKRIQALVNRPSQQRQDSPDGQPDDLQTPEHDSKQEWESWDRWRPVWGGLCLTRADDVRDEGRTAPLPMTVTYSTERELTALGTLRMSVALLQQELCLETTLSETLSPQFCSVIRGPLNPSLLRDLYSVLGEGGERFPALVLDSEPDS
uniref:Uncharacterized protein n=1 Tax=Knipowitschia caucasica TaxID=637954 RepID=A0AAV2KHD8_KNICA